MGLRPVESTETWQTFPSRPTSPPQKMDQARSALETAIGADKVFFEDLDRTGLPRQVRHRRCRATIPPARSRPKSVEEVQAAVNIANQYRLPLLPISRGKNFGYGGTAPELAGAVVIDLSGMKKIEFDAVNGVATLEPGVGFYDLYDYLQKNDLPFWLSTPGNSWGSVIGNALDRGVGYTPYGENTKNLCGLEVVLPDRRSGAHRHGRLRGRADLGALSVRLRPGVGPDVRPVEFRHRHQGQHVADARARKPDGHGRRIRQARRPQGHGRHHRPAAPRRLAAAIAQHRQLAARRVHPHHARRMDRQARRAVATT